MPRLTRDARWLRRGLPLLLLAAGALLSWVVARGRPAPAASAREVLRPRVEVVEVAPGDHEVTLRAHGTVQARTEIELVAEVAGRVVAIAPSLAAGGFFERGDVLVEIDRTDAELALERTEASRLRAGSELRLARAQLERRRALVDREIGSAAQLEEAEHGEQLALARTREARVARDQARRDLDRTRIRAPFDGRVREKGVGVGQFVVRGVPVARIYAVDYAEVRLPLPSPDLAFLGLPLSGASLPPEQAPRAVLRADFAGRTSSWPARIVRVEGEIAARSRMLHVVARVDDPYGVDGADGPPLTVGLFVEAEIPGRTLRGVTVLPRSALAEASRVLVVDADGRLRARDVEIVRRDDEHVVVRGGLAAGERVVASGAAVAPGTLVRAHSLDDASPASIAVLP